MLAYDRLMEKHMGITYADLSAQNFKLRDKYAKRKKLLQAGAIELCKQYIDSLGLESTSWTNAQGYDVAYVTKGILNREDCFEKKSLGGVTLDDHYSLNFAIRTVVDTEAEYAVVVEVSLSYQDDCYLATVHGYQNGKSIIIPELGEDTSFNEVAGAIKNRVMMDLTDSRLD